MIVLISGASHTGKTLLAQKLMELVHIPYLSIDHLKMGLIRSHQCRLNALSEDDALTQYLWPIVREMIKTALENEQHLIIEGCYIPWDWQKDFSADELNRIRFICLLMSDAYLCAHFDEVKKHADVIEKRLDDDCTLEGVRQDNARMRQLCALHDLPHVLIDEHYPDDLARQLQKAWF